MLQLEVLILKLLAIDTLTAGAIASSEITALNHERLDDSVEAGTLVVERGARLALALLACAEGSEVVCGLWNDIIVLEWRSAPRCGEMI